MCMERGWTGSRGLLTRVVVDEGCCLARSARYGAGLDGVKRVVDEGCCLARSVWSGAGRGQEGC